MRHYMTCSIVGITHLISTKIPPTCNLHSSHILVFNPQNTSKINKIQFVPLRNSPSGVSFLLINTDIYFYFSHLSFSPRNLGQSSCLPPLFHRKPQDLKELKHAHTYMHSVALSTHYENNSPNRASSCQDLFWAGAASSLAHRAVGFSVVSSRTWECVGKFSGLCPESLYDSLVRKRQTVTGALGSNTSPKLLVLSLGRKARIPYAKCLWMT